MRAIRLLKEISALLVVISGTLLGIFDIQYLGSNFRNTLFGILVTTGAIGLISFIIDNAFGFIESKRNRQTINNLLDKICLTLNDKTHDEFRCNIMQPEGFCKKYLKISHYSEEFEESMDRDIHFEKYQGCAGTAWGTKDNTVAIMTLPREIGTAGWNLTHQQSEVTKELKTIVSVPVFHEGRPHNVWYILNVDSKTWAPQNIDIQKDVIMIVEEIRAAAVIINDLIMQERIA